MLVLYWGTTKPFYDGAYDASSSTAMQALQSISSQGFLGSQTAAVRMANASATAGMGLVESSLPGDIEKAQRESIALEGPLTMLHMANRVREDANQRNANLLGYMQEINDRNDVSRYAGGGAYYDDLISDIEEERYYIVIAAYDF